MPTTIVRYLNHAADPGGNGTTNALSSGDGSHAYDSLEAWQAAESTDLVVADEEHVLYWEGASVTRNTPFSIGGWTTDSTHRVIIEVPASHAWTSGSGGWDATRAGIYYTGVSQGALRTNSNVVIRRVQIYSYRTNYLGSCFVSGSTGHVNIEFDACLARANTTGTSGYGSGNGFYIPGNSTDGPYKLKNCVAYECGYSAANGGAAIWSNYPPVYAYNCTAYKCRLGVRIASALPRVQNCVSQLCAGNDFYVPSGNRSHNLSSDATAPGTDAIINSTLTFVDAANGNFRLVASDTDAIDTGVDLSTDAYCPFADDADGVSRPQGSAWDRGAFEYVAAGGAATLFRRSNPLQNRIGTRMPV